MQIKPEHRLPTGNDVVSIPSLSAASASAPEIGVLSMKYRGTVEFHGDDKAAFFKPWFKIGPKTVVLAKEKLLHAGRTEHWVPSFALNDKICQTEIRVIAPLQQRGFILEYRIKNLGTKPLKVMLGAEGSWRGMRARHNGAYPLRLWRRGEQFEGLDTKHLILTAGAEGPEFAVAIGGSQELDIHEFAAGTPPKASSKWARKNLELAWDSPKGLHWQVGKNLEVGPKQDLHFGIYFGLGLDAVSAAASSVEMRRQGLDTMVDSTLRFLNRRTKFTGDSHLDQLLNLNLWFNYFYAMGTTLDSEDFCCLTSRSPHYEELGAHRDRDSMLWSFPAVLMVDANRARQMLEYAFGIQGNNMGARSRFLSGAVLEPGFELDALCAPVIALSNYVKNTGDYSLLKENHVRKAIRRVEKALPGRKHPSQWLYETLLGPDGDFEPLSYLAYDNALVWRLQQALIELKPKMNRDKDVAGHKDLSEKVRSAVWKHLTADGPRGKMFVWSSDLRGKHRFSTSPAGCLQLLPYFGFCEPTEPVWRNTVTYLHSKEFQYSFADAPFEEIGSGHTPQPWTLAICNRLLSGQRDKVKSLLEKLDFDGGIACESFDSKTGKPSSGLAFAACAGFLAWGIWKAFGKTEGTAPQLQAAPKLAPPAPSPGAEIRLPLPLPAAVAVKQAKAAPAKKSAPKKKRK